MGDTREPEPQRLQPGPDSYAPAPSSPFATTSSILGQAPFKLDLRIAPRPSENGRDRGRLKPVDRELLPDLTPPEPPAPAVVEAPQPAPSSDETVAAEPATDGDASAGAGGVHDESGGAEGAPGADAQTGTLSDDGSALAAAAPVPATAPVAVAPTLTLPTAAPAPSIAARTIALPQQLTLAPIAPRVAASDAAQPAALDFTAIAGQRPRPQRARRNPIGVLFKLAVLGALIFGGVYAVKKYLLAPKWQEDVKVFADAVSDARGLEWEDAVQVDVLPAADYGRALAISQLGVTDADEAALVGEWRAMGLAEGDLDLATIGNAAAADQPAFYDATSGHVYELAGLSPELRGIALSRALTLALLDQHFAWADRAGADDPGLRFAIRALFDGDAVDAQATTTLEALSGDPARTTAISAEIGLLRFQGVSSAGPAPAYGVAVLGPAADATSPLFHDAVTAAQRTAAEEIPVLSDANVLDGARSRSAQPADLGAQTRTVGMLYWYHALAGRIGNDAAWAAAVHWNGDTTVVTTSSSPVCVTATIAADDPAGQMTLLAALGQWADLAPPEATTSVAASGDDRIEVASCDPGPAADTVRSADVPLFGNAPQELAVVGAMLAAGLADTDEARACVVNSLRSDAVVPAIERTDIDRSLSSLVVDLDTADAQMLMESCRSL